MTDNKSRDIKDEINEQDLLFRDQKIDVKSELDSRFLWIIIPIVIGGCISIFSNFEQEVQLIIWGLMVIIAGFGIWSHTAKRIRKRRDELEKIRWGNLDNRFDKIDERFDEVDARFDLSENTDKTLLRNEIVKFHREWVEQKGYITLEALEYVDRIHEAYNAVHGNDTGDQLWKDLHSLPIRENRNKSVKQSQ